MRTANPALNNNTFGNESIVSTQKMTLDGTKLINASFYYFVSWQQHTTRMESSLSWLFRTSKWINGFRWISRVYTALITVFKKSAAPITTPLYALSQGLFLGGFLAILEQSYPGIVIQAVALTFGTLFCLLSANQTNQSN